MQQTFSEYIRTCGVNGFCAAAKRFTVVVALALIVPASAFAYTVVMRSGRRVEIPSTFTATRTTLTYEYAPGIYVTLQMASIDIAATDRANNEQPGSFLKRLAQQATAQMSTSGTSGATEKLPRRTLTDKDLESSRRARQQSEEAYERRRTELGLPSLEEQNSRREEEVQRAREQLRQSEEEEAQSEAYWRSRASALRAEIAALDGEINYLRARLAEIPDPFSSGSFTVVTSVVPLQPFGHGPFTHPFPHPAFTHPPFVPGHTGIAIPNGTGAQTTGRIGFSVGSIPGQVLINPAGTVTPFGQQQAAAAFGLRRQLIAPFFTGAPLAFVGASPFYQSFSYERELIFARLDELAARRAGLQARWRVLEDEARRAGALPGWLRP